MEAKGLVHVFFYKKQLYKNRTSRKMARNPGDTKRSGRVHIPIIFKKGKNVQFYELLGDLL